MTQQHGRRYEHTLVNDLEDVTPEEVWVTSAGYSGNAKSDDCDIVVTLDPQLALSTEQIQYNIEAKKRQGDSGNRVIVASGSSGEETGVDEVERLLTGTPAWADPILAIKFDHRKLVVLDARWLLSALGESKRPVPESVREGVLSVLGPRTTPSGSVSMIKPSLDSWESSQAAQRDAVVLAGQLGLPYDQNNE